jgi:hypothetical protein
MLLPREGVESLFSKKFTGGWLKQFFFKVPFLGIFFERNVYFHNQDLVVSD